MYSSLRTNIYLVAHENDLTRRRRGCEQYGGRWELPMSGLTKYRGLIIAVTLFLLVIASVTIANFLIARDLDQDAISVNLAGRQRMLSQRTAKTVFQLSEQSAQGQDTSATLKELTGAVQLFDSTLSGFRTGGSVTGGAGQTLVLRRAQVGQDKIAQTTEIWNQYQSQLEPVLRSQAFSLDSQSLSALNEFAAKNNVTILTLMNELTTALEKQSTDRAAFLRLIQIIALSIALLLFAYIVFFTLRNLRKADAEVLAAKAETDNILNTVNDGLFLVDRELKIGNQVSKSLSTIFGVSNLPGKNLMNVLAELVPEKTRETAKSFLDLLFGDRVKEALMGDVNPLKEVEIKSVEPDGRVGIKYLAFQFKRVLDGEKLSHLLVSAADISSEVQLRQELVQTQKRNEAQISLLAKMMHVSTPELSAFMDKTQRGLDEMNSVLSSGGMSKQEHVSKLAQLFRIVHTVKGDAAALDFDPIESWAHRFEDHIHALRKQATIEGNDLLPLTVQMRELYTQISGIRDLAQKMSQVRSTLDVRPSADAGTNAKAQPSVWAKAQLLSERVAERAGKKIKLNISKEPGVRIPSAQFHETSDALVQLVRNAIVHGIEDPIVRAANGKPEQGKLQIHIGAGAPGTIEISVEDDGLGIDLEKIRTQAIQSGALTAAEAVNANPQQLVRLLFASGFSTAANVTEDAGRGVGLDVVEKSIKKIGGRVSLASRAGRGARFTLVLPEDWSEEGEAR
jgi:two-component system, chemotaxis family, sensor kinase CheA